MASFELGRLLCPKSVAVVGASESQRMSNSIVNGLMAAGVVPVLVNPRHPKQYGLPTLPDLAALGTPVDAVVSLVGAQRTVEVISQAAALDCGGVVALAGGFAEAGPEGIALQERLVAAAREASLPVIGPNCAGFANLHDRVRVFSGAALPLQPGGLAVVSQSGFFVRAAWAAGLERQLGFSFGISSGNEAVCGLADYVSFLAADERTRAILVVLEKVRDPQTFFAAAHEAQRVGKPVIALKLGQSSRGRAIAQSHTGALASEAWTYEAALKQAGVLIATDVDDLLDQAQLFELTPRARWRPMKNIGVVSTSGGVAALAADIGEREGVSMPIPDGLQQWVVENLPTSGPANPLDVTGFAVSQADTLKRLFERYSSEPGFDAFLLAWWTGEHDEEWARALTDPFAATAGKAPHATMMLAAAHAGALGTWATALRTHGVIVGRGMQSLLRSCTAMTRFVQARATHVGNGLAQSPRIPCPAGAAITTAEGPMLAFDATMKLLASFGLPVAPYMLIDEAPVDVARLAALGNRLVLKLANIPHRTEYGAVQVNVAPEDAADVAARLRSIAAQHGFDPQVVAQRMVPGAGEAFVGIQGDSDFGPLLVFGLGGIFVELVKKVSGRVLPIGEAETAELLDEVGGETVFAGLRGQAPWDREALGSLLRAAGEFGVQSRDWLASLDLNPVICSADGCTLVDAVVLLKP